MHSASAYAAELNVSRGNVQREVRRGESVQRMGRLTEWQAAGARATATVATAPLQGPGRRKSLM